MLNAELSAQGLASRVGVDAKSVTRWLSEDRVPHPLTRIRVARVLDQQETFLWPALLDGDDGQGVVGAELDRVWPTRSSIPTETRHALFSRAARELDILVYAGGFLLETLDLADVIGYKAGAGAQVRILIGDPDSDAVKVRAAEERLSWLPERCRTTGQCLSQVRSAPGVGVRLHGTTLCASLFRFDDVILVNQHAYGAWACQAPVHQVRRVRDGYLFDFYRAVFRAYLAGRCRSRVARHGGVTFAVCRRRNRRARSTQVSPSSLPPWRSDQAIPAGSLSGDVDADGIERVLEVEAHQLQVARFSIDGLEADPQVCNWVCVLGSRFVRHVGAAGVGEDRIPLKQSLPYPTTLMTTPV